MSTLKAFAAAFYLLLSPENCILYKKHEEYFKQRITMDDQAFKKIALDVIREKCLTDKELKKQLQEAGKQYLESQTEVNLTDFFVEGFYLNQLIEILINLEKTGYKSIYLNADNAIIVSKESNGSSRTD